MDYKKNFSLFLHQAADLAAGISLQYFRKDIEVIDKADYSPVTQADREIEKVLRELIGNTFPDHGVLGEEFGVTNKDAEFVWVIDPIDGTRAFMTGKPLFGTVIGLMHKGLPKVGIIDQPFTKERWFGISDQMATHNGRDIRVSPSCLLNEARLYTGSPEMFEGQYFDNYLSLCRTVKWPQYACDCYAYGLVAMGHADLVIERKLALYDIAGIVPILTGAGGFMSDWSFKPISFDFSGTVIAANSRNLASMAVAKFILVD